MINIYNSDEYGEIVQISEAPTIEDTGIGTLTLLRPANQEELGLFLDEELESANHHGWVGLGAELSKLIYNRNLLENVVLEVFHRI